LNRADIARLAELNIKNHVWVSLLKTDKTLKIIHELSNISQNILRKNKIRKLIKYKKTEEDLAYLNTAEGILI